MFSGAEHELAQLLNTGHAALLKGGKTGLEKESLRVGPDGSIAQTSHPRVLGSALTHPWITTDYSEALLEFITPPMDNPIEALTFLRDLQHFVYLKLDRELLWSASMPCVVEGESHIPIAEYGTSNAGLMKTVYRRGLGHRYGRVMQVIAGAHYNYSFPEAFWPAYRELERNTLPLQDFISDCYFRLIRNLQRFGWLVPYLFGASPAVCKSFMCGRPTLLQEFNQSSYYGPYATSLRMCDIGYQNAHEKETGFKAVYDNLNTYVESLTRAIGTSCPRYESIGVKVDGEYRQLNANILQIENEYYSSIRPKQVPVFNEKPTLALLRRGVRYVELRSLDINIFDPVGISATQCRFLEALMAFCLLQESPPITAREQDEIDHNLDAVCYRGREPGLQLRCNGKAISLRQWATELCTAMSGFAGMLDDGLPDTPYARALQAQFGAIEEPDCTPSARVLAGMRAHNEGYFEYARRKSLEHQQYFLNLAPAAAHFQLFADAVEQSLDDQLAMESGDSESFDEFLQAYFAQTP